MYTLSSKLLRSSLVLDSFSRRESLVLALTLKESFADGNFVVLSGRGECSAGNERAWKRQLTFPKVLPPNCSRVAVKISSER
jgi:hypothetical protein